MSQNNKGRNTHLFQLEILVEDETNAKALERLLHVLNQGDFADFRVTSGVELGRIIDAVREQADETRKKGSKASSGDSAQAAPASPIGKSASAQAGALTTSQPARASKQAASPEPAQADNPFSHITSEFRDYMAQNKLIRLRINKGLGVSLNIPGRIINLDEDTGLLTVYHVDEKQVYTFKLNEIDDYSV